MPGISGLDLQAKLNSDHCPIPSIFITAHGDETMRLQAMRGGAVKFAGFLHVSQLAVKQMVQQKSGSIVNVSTTLVDQPIAGVDAAVQIMLKGALNAVTRALAIEYAKDGIRVNTVALGVINTPMHKPETHGFLKGLHPLGRMGEIQEVVEAVLFLTDATFTSGEILHVDGGAHAGKW